MNGLRPLNTSAVMYGGFHYYPIQKINRKTVHRMKFRLTQHETKLESSEHDHGNYKVDSIYPFSNFHA